MHSPDARESVEPAASLFGDADGNTADFFSSSSPVIPSNPVPHDAPQEFASNLFGSSDDSQLLPQEVPYENHAQPEQQVEVFDETSIYPFDDGPVTHTAIPHDSSPGLFETDAGASPTQSWNAYEPSSEHPTQLDLHSNDYVPSYDVKAPSVEVHDSTFPSPQDPYAPMQPYSAVHSSNSKRPYLDSLEGWLISVYRALQSPRPQHLLIFTGLRVQVTEVISHTHFIIILC